MQKTKLSVLVHCYNNEQTIRELLENVKWADEIVICDSFSTDKTVEICRKYTDKVYQYVHKNSADQKNWAIPKCNHDWILHVDTDEELSNELVQEIKKIMAGTDIKYEAFKVLFKFYIFGKPVKGANLYPCYKIRLFRKHLRFEDKYIHANLIVKGQIGVLSGYISHFGWEDMKQIRRRFKRHRKLCFLRRKSENKSYRLYELILRPPAIFLYIYISQRGFIDGWRGVFNAGFYALLEFYILKDFLFSTNKVD